MRVIIQRVSQAKVKVDDQIKSQMRNGMLIFVGIEDSDNDGDIEWLAKKIVNLRIFDDQNGIMNHSVLDKQYEIMVVSQFTLFASTKKGNRPSYIRASKPNIAIPFYEKFCQELNTLTNKKIKTGVFGADMKIDLINDGPVTILIDSKQRE